MAETLAVTKDLEGITSAVRPDYKTQRYDRQLRLWASAGQTALERASVLVINGSATATQSLKNLVLPGIGSFTILDPKTTDASDVGVNFFLVNSSVDKKRAEEATVLLKELNDSVNGSAIVQNVETFLASADALSPFNLVISVDASTSDTLALSDRCWKAQIPLVTVRSNGFIGSIRTQIPEMAFVETHPDSLVDLRLDAPFPALAEYVKGLDFEAMDSADHGHLPAVVIVIRALEIYKQQHDGKIPKLTKERNELKSIITSMKRQSDEENFDEALALVVKLARRSGVPDDIQQLFQDAACVNLSPSSPSFWILLRAVKEFVGADPLHLLPLTGALPDMKATSAGYLKLQNLYRTKAKQDLQAVTSKLHAILESLGMPLDAIPEDQIATFVKHAGYVTVIRGTNLANEASTTTKSPEAIRQELEEEDQDSALNWLVALKASEMFEAARHTWPDQAADSDDQALLESFAIQLLAQHGVVYAKDELPESVSNALEEITRAGGAELPQIAALLGGIVAQEAIKLITRQYVALNGTMIWDGIKSRTQVVSF